MEIEHCHHSTALSREKNIYRSVTKVLFNPLFSFKYSNIAYSHAKLIKTLKKSSTIFYLI